jgi:glycosyltransferase involved in cell wall biosynthesis
LFAGRFVPEKDLMTLIRAYKLAAMENSVLMFIGDGGLKTQLTTFASQHDMDDVMFFGFKNRQEISRFFSVADVVVLPSIRETWGLVVNEALCFSVPVILSDQVGSVYDLVDPAQNGFVFIAGDATSLADKLETLHDMPIENRRQMRAKSLQKITDWINRDNIGELLKFTRSTVK